MSVEEDMFSMFAEDELEQYKAAFDTFDKDGSGVISIKDFLKVLRNLGQNLSKEEAEMVINEIDPDMTGEVDFRQFILYIRKIRMQDEINLEEAVDKAFQTFSNKSDIISLSVLKQVLCNYGQDRFTSEECDEMFKEVGLSEEGVPIDGSAFNYKEFMDHWKKIAEHQEALNS